MSSADRDYDVNKGRIEIANAGTEAHARIAKICDESIARLEAAAQLRAAGGSTSVDNADAAVVFDFETDPRSPLERVVFGAFGGYNQWQDTHQLSKSIAGGHYRAIILLTKVEKK